MESFQSLISQAKNAGLINDRKQIHTRALKESPAVDKLEFRDFNERIGNPWSRILDERVPLTDYQVFYHESINKYHRIMVNKTKKGAFTEGFLRHAAKEVFGHYAGHEVIFMAGNAAPIALDVLERFNNLFEEENGFIDQNDKKWAYGDLIMSFTRSAPMKLELYNGTRILGTPASKSGKAQAMRGYSDVVAWFLTEAAHTGLNDDYPIINGLTSLTANRPDGHSILESTPNGKRGFFYELWYDATNKLQDTFKVGPNDYYTLEYDYKIAVEAGVISREFIEREKKNKKIDFDQEYGCKFTTTDSAAFDDLVPSNFTENDAMDLSSL